MLSSKLRNSLFVFLPILSFVLAACGGGGGGSSAAQTTLAPAVSAISPSSGPVGTLVTIKGGPFATSVFQNQVKIGGASANVSLASSDTLIVAVPFGAKTGPISVTVAGSFIQSAGNFIVNPMITGISPSSAPIGSNVTIQGSALENPTQVTIGGVAVSIVDSTYESVTVVIPPGIGSGPVQVVTADGVASAPSPFKIAPAILAFFPASAKQGDSITLLGTSLQGVTKVSFNGVDALSFQNPDPGTVVATVPPGAGSGAIVITTGDGSATSPGNLTVLPTVGVLAPGSGVVGASVSIQGTAFFGVTDVLFGAAPAAFSVSDSFTISATVPLAATSGPITVKTSSGNALSAGNFTVLPALLSFNPSFGPEGTSVTIQGTSFQGVASVAFGGVAAPSFSNPDSQTLVVSVPPSAKTGSIVVTTADGAATSAGSFVVKPVIADFSPKTGPVAAEVKIEGTTLVNVTGVTFNGMPAASFTNPDEHTVLAVAPEGVTNGIVAVTTVDGMVQTASAYTVVYPRFVWAANDEGTISQFTLEAKTGALRHSGYQLAGTNPNFFALHPTGQWAYVTNGGSNDVSAYSVDSASGALTALQTVSSVGTKPVSIAFDATGAFAFIASETSGQIATFQVGSDGKLNTAGITTALGGKPRRIVADPSGKFLYVPNESLNKVFAFKIEANGALTLLGSPATGSAPQQAAIDPSGKFLFVANDGTSDLSAYAIAADGTLTAKPSVAAGAKPRSVFFDYSGKFLFVVHGGSNELWVYKVAANGTATFSDKKAAGTAPESATIDASGRFLAVASKGSNEVPLLTLDRATGLLSSSGKMRARVAPAWIASARGAASIVYTPKFAVWANEASATIAAASISAADGVLTSGGTQMGGSGASTITSDLAGKTLISSGYTSNSLGAYGVNSDGSISLLGGAAVDAHPVSAALEPSIRFVYCTSADAAVHIVQPYRLTFLPNGLIGFSKFGLPLSLGSLQNPLASAMDPAGRFLFVLTSDGINGGTLTTVEIKPVGSISWTVPAMFFPSKEGKAVTVDPSGQFVYAVANVGPDYPIYGYRIGSGTGKLTQVDNKPTGTKPVALAFEPTGRFLYIACLYGNGGNGSVVAFSKNASTGVLTQIQALSVSKFPSGVSVDPSGKFLITNNQGSNDIGVFAIDSTTGLISAVVGSPFANGAGSTPGPVFATGSVQ